MSEDINVGAISEALNNKVDLNSSWSTPSHTYIDVSVGASGTSYTAPANGYFVAQASQAYSLSLEGGGNGNRIHSTIAYPQQNWIRIFVPVAKGDTKVMYYSGNTPSLQFVYAQDTN